MEKLNSEEFFFVLNRLYNNIPCGLVWYTPEIESKIRFINEIGFSLLGYSSKKELISKTQNSNYKKKPCKTFTESGFCPYGSRCSFKHDERSLKEIKLPFYYVNLFFKNKIDTNHKRLTIFESITNCKQEQTPFIHSSSTSTSTISNEDSGDEESYAKKMKILNFCEEALNDNN